jgi:hypothetical protein
MSAKLTQSLLPLKYVYNPSKGFIQNRKSILKTKSLPYKKPTKNRSFMWRTKIGARKLSSHLKQDSGDLYLSTGRQKMVITPTAQPPGHPDMDNDSLLSISMCSLDIEN